MCFSKDHAGTHDENRSKICLFCLKKRGRSRKNEIRKIVKNGPVELLIIKDIFEYDASDKNLPNGICKTCLNKLYATKGKTKKLLKKPEWCFHYKTINTRSSDGSLKCDCLICKLARQRPGIHGQNQSKALQKMKDKLEGLYLRYYRCFIFY